jgi:hypothetical protein
MSDSGEGTASGDYDNETAGLEEKMLYGKRTRIDAEVRVEATVDDAAANLNDWEADGGRRCEE